MRTRSVMTTVALALSVLAAGGDAATASSGPGTTLWAATPVAPILHRGYPCVFLVGGPFDQYVYVAGQTAQTRTGWASIYSAATGQLLWRRRLTNGSVTVHTSRGQNVAWFRVTINGVTCGPGPVD